MDFIGKRKYFLLCSLMVSIISIIVIFFPGVNLGVDFTSGTSITYEFRGSDPGLEKIRSALGKSGHGDATIQQIGQGQYFIRTTDLGTDGKDIIDEEIQNIKNVDFITLDTTSVGKSVADDTVRNAFIAVLVASAFVMVYIMYAFRTVPQSYKYAISAIIALTHDVLIVLGLFTIIGIVFGSEINAIFIVGILTIIGYSVNDTIVIFDRVRENVILSPNRSFRCNYRYL